MSRSMRLSRCGRLLSALMAVAAVTAGGWSAQAAPTLPSDGLEIPGLGDDAPDSCSITSSDPKNRDSCNAEGGNGSDGEPGAVHRNGRTYYGGDDGDSGSDNAKAEYTDGAY